jgi:outer membrane protein assembly factor BamB
LGCIIDAAPAYANGLLYVPSLDGNLYVFDPSTGQSRRAVPLGSKLHSSPAIANGRLYLGAEDGKLYCLQDAGAPSGPGSAPPGLPIRPGG